MHPKARAHRGACTRRRVHTEVRAPGGACTRRRVHTAVQVAFGGAREPFVKGHPSVDPLMPCLADPCVRRGTGGEARSTRRRVHTEVHRPQNAQRRKQRPMCTEAQ